MKFFVIYSFDLTRNTSVKEYQPPDVRKWELTEGDEQYEYNYLADENPWNASFWRNGKHRKYVRELNKNQFKEFIRKTDLRYEDIQTMGSLTGFGWLPAMSFTGDNSLSYYNETEGGAIYQGAYVTPFVEPVRDFRTRFSKMLEGIFPQESFWPLTPEEIKTYWGKKEEKLWGWLESAMKTEFSY